jgi:hypothetical protein
MLKLSIFNAQGSRVIIVVVVQVRAVKTYERKEGMKLNLLPKLVEKLVWVPVISFPVTHLMPYYAF